MVGSICGLMLVALVVWVLTNDIIWAYLNREEPPKVTGLKWLTAYIGGAILHSINVLVNKIYYMFIMPVRFSQIAIICKSATVRVRWFVHCSISTTTGQKNCICKCNAVRPVLLIETHLSMQLQYDYVSTICKQITTYLQMLKKIDKITWRLKYIFLKLQWAIRCCCKRFNDW